MGLYNRVGEVRGKTGEIAATPSEMVRGKVLSGQRVRICRRSQGEGQDCADQRLDSAGRTRGRVASLRSDRGRWQGRSPGLVRCHERIVRMKEPRLFFIF